MLKHPATQERYIIVLLYFILFSGLFNQTPHELTHLVSEERNRVSQVDSNTIKLIKFKIATSLYSWNHILKKKKINMLIPKKLIKSKHKQTRALGLRNCWSWSKAAGSDYSAFWITALGHSSLFVHHLPLQQSCACFWSCPSHFGKFTMLCLVQESAKEKVTTVKEHSFLPITAGT